MNRLAAIRHVRQEHPGGCVIASLAMLGGETYAAVLAQYPWVDGREGGCDLETVSHDYFFRHGLACHTIWPSLPEINRDPAGDMGERRARYGRKPWPPEPWAPAHLCEVTTSQSHAVVMLADGAVLDPLDPSPRTLAAYGHVSNVRGVWDIAP